MDLARKQSVLEKVAARKGPKTYPISRFLTSHGTAMGSGGLGGLIGGAAGGPAGAAVGAGIGGLYGLALNKIHRGIGGRAMRGRANKLALAKTTKEIQRAARGMSASELDTAWRARGHTRVSSKKAKGLAGLLGGKSRAYATPASKKLLLALAAGGLGTAAFKAGERRGKKSED